MQQRQVIPIRIPGAAYDVVIQPGILAGVAEFLGATRPNRIAVISDANLPPSHVLSLLSGLSPASIIAWELPGGEDNKTLSRVAEAYDKLLADGIDRHTPLIALGGGVTGDLAGFVAATVLRGVPLIQVPTSLLAMVDASVGGKVGVNHGRYKNMIGAFKQPIAVIIDPSLLRTLPDVELRNGLAECIKHAIIRDESLFADTDRQLDRILARDEDALTHLIARNVAIKARVVEADPYESGERMHLNFGHTFGHAIETVSQHAYSHGQAVALGMCAACHAAAALRMLSDDDRARVKQLLQRAGLPTSGLRLDIEALRRAVTHDKKASQGRPRFVLPTRIGQVVVRDDVPDPVIRAAFESLREG